MSVLHAPLKHQYENESSSNPHRLALNRSPTAATATVIPLGEIKSLMYRAVSCSSLLDNISSKRGGACSSFEENVSHLTPLKKED